MAAMKLAAALATVAAVGLAFLASDAGGVPEGAGLAAPGARADGKALYLQPLGRDLPDADVALISGAMVEFYGLQVKVPPRVELPAAACSPPRKRWRADRLID